jgi:hypothetical protein
VVWRVGELQGRLRKTLSHIRRALAEGRRVVSRFVSRAQISGGFDTVLLQGSLLPANCEMRTLYVRRGWWFG